jgi:hypothetical protein
VKEAEAMTAKVKDDSLERMDAGVQTDYTPLASPTRRTPLTPINQQQAMSPATVLFSPDRSPRKPFFSPNKSPINGGVEPTLSVDERLEQVQRREEALASKAAVMERQRAGIEAKAAKLNTKISTFNTMVDTWNTTRQVPIASTSPVAPSLKRAHSGNVKDENDDRRKSTNYEKPVEASVWGATIKTILADNSTPLKLRASYM